MKTLYEAYDQDDVPMEEFAGVTLDDLYLGLDVLDDLYLSSSKMYACIVTRIAVESAL